MHIQCWVKGILNSAEIRQGGERKRDRKGETERERERFCMPRGCVKITNIIEKQMMDVVKECLAFYIKLVHCEIKMLFVICYM